MPAIAVIPKRPNEKFEIVLRYFAPDLQSNENIANVAATLSPANNGMNFVGNANYANNEVTQWIEGGNNGNEYTVTFLTTIDSGRILEHYVIIDVDN